MQRLSSRLVLAGVASALLASCAGGGERAPAPRAPRPPSGYKRPPAAAPAPSAAAYVARASSIDLFVIRSSEIALRRSLSQRVRDFARTEITAHDGMGKQLSFAGRRLNQLPSATLQPKHQAMLHALDSAANFDALYRRDQLAVHQEALELHRNYAARGRSPTMKPVAKNALPIIERHLRQLRYL